MKYKKNQVKQARKFKNIITIENHLYDEGFGSWLNELFLERGLKKNLSSLYSTNNLIGKVESEDTLIKKNI